MLEHLSLQFWRRLMCMNSKIVKPQIRYAQLLPSVILLQIQKIHLKCEKLWQTSVDAHINPCHQWEYKIQILCFAISLQGREMNHTQNLLNWMRWILLTHGDTTLNSKCIFKQFYQFNIPLVWRSQWEIFQELKNEILWF